MRIFSFIYIGCFSPFSFHIADIHSNLNISREDYCKTTIFNIILIYIYP